MVCLSHLVVGFSSKQEIAIEHPSSDSELGDAEGCESESEGEASTGKSAIPLVKGMDPKEMEQTLEGTAIPGKQGAP